MPNAATLLLCFALCLAPSLRAQVLQLRDAYPTRSRYAPGERVELTVELDGTPHGGETVSADVMDLGRQSGRCGPIRLAAGSGAELKLPCTIPADDFRGYLVDVHLQAANGERLGSSKTAIDVSSDWRRFPRYGYLAHYNAAEGADPAAWVAELNRFHINGLEFYDFQYRHDQPLAGTVEHPAAQWKDIANRDVDASIVRGFIDQAHQRNMMAMAYNASYSAYEDVFTRQNPLPLKWGTWRTADGARRPDTAKSFDLGIPGWSTSKLFYMNQNDRGWQTYVFGQMQQLFDAYPFDGWHIDTFGEKSGYAFDGSPVDYIAGFRPYIDHAHASLHKRILFNAVNTFGQAEIAISAADFVYSELWEDHETFASILGTAEQVHLANPHTAYVLAAYLHRQEGNHAPHVSGAPFNTPSVLLTDAVIFSAGAAHIELGDGDRMLSSEYFPADTRFQVSPELRQQLRHYYDFLTAYELYLRDGTTLTPSEVKVEGYPTDSLGVANTLWSITRQHGSMTMVHLINLMGSEDDHWRDITRLRPDSPRLKNLRVQLRLPERVRSVGWASPDVEGGQFHELRFEQQAPNQGNEVTVTMPELHYWDTLFVSTQARP